MIVAGRLDAQAFAPFGALIEAPARAGERAMYGDWLVPLPGLALQFHLNRVARAALPLVLDQVERHPHAAQVFLPVDVSRYLVTVMPSDGGGAPAPDRALSFILPGTAGVVYRPGAWHAGITALDRDASFAVLMWRGAADDDVFAPIAPVMLHIAPAAQTGTDR